MNITRVFILILLLCPALLSSQSLFDAGAESNFAKSYTLGGFTRAGFFSNNLSDDPTLSTGFADLALNLSAEDGRSYKAYADLRFRYGMEFGNQTSDFGINEAYISWYSRWIELSAGQQIVKWSNSDFFKTVDKINPRDELFRTFDDTDRDLGNIMIRTKIFPVDGISLELMYMPYKRPSILPTEVMNIPSFVKINKLDELRLDINNGSWAANMGFNLKSIDIGISWFRGSNPMPMICYDTLRLQQQPGEVPTELELNAAQYDISMFSSNIGIVAGRALLRGEFTYLLTDKSGTLSDYIPNSELIWTSGIEISPGNFRFLLEYQGKHILDFTEPESDPSFPESIVLPPGMPPELLEEMVIEQVSTFNRLYTYQLNEMNHSMAIRLAYDNNISSLKPELNVVYNITTGDTMINPILSIKPADNLNIIIGSDMFYGEKDSLYDLLDSELTSIYMGLKISF